MKDEQPLRMDIASCEAINCLIDLSCSEFRSILKKIRFIFILIRTRRSLRKLYGVSYRIILLNRWRHHRDEKHKAKASA